MVHQASAKLVYVFSIFFYKRFNSYVGIHTYENSIFTAYHTAMRTGSIGGEDYRADAVLVPSRAHAFPVSHCAEFPAHFALMGSSRFRAVAQQVIAANLRFAGRLRV